MKIYVGEDYKEMSRKAANIYVSPDYFKTG